MPDNNEKSPLEQAKASMRRGMLEFCILLTVSRGRVYATDILKRLKEADMLVVEGTLYPLLTRLKTEGLAEYEWEESASGPPRKYFSLTAKGREQLAQLKLTWKSLAASVDALTD